MDSKPLRSRRFHVFLSHAHADVGAVEHLQRWLERAGLSVWHDSERMPGGALFPTELAAAIADSRSVIVVVTRASLESGWVLQECNHAMVQTVNDPQFAIVPVVLDDAAPDATNLGSLLLARSAVRASGGRPTGPEASRLLRSLHGIRDAVPAVELKARIVESLATRSGSEASPLVGAHHPVFYVTSGWRRTPEERRLREQVGAWFPGSTLVGDAEDHATTDATRVKAILSGCDGHVIALPRRGDGRLSSPEYRSLCAEIGWARELGVPRLYVLQDGVDIGDIERAPDGPCVVASASDPDIAGRIQEWCDVVRRSSGGGRFPHYVFVATDYDDLVVQDHVVRHVSQITGLPCLVGRDFSGRRPSNKIECAIRAASLVIANIVSEGSGAQPRVNWNTCIEAGIALGAGRPLHVIARRARGETWSIHDSIPFMLRSDDVSTYADDAELVALVHRLTRPYRRRLIAG